MGLLTGERGGRFGRHLGGGAAAGSSDDRGDEAFDEGRRAEDDPAPGGAVEQVECELRAEDGAAEVEEHDDTIRTVDAFDRLLHLDGVGAQRGLVQSRGQRHGRPAAVQHLPGQLDRGAGE